MRRRPRAGGLVLLLVVTLLAAGCGGKTVTNNSGSTSAAAPTTTTTTTTGSSSSGSLSRTQFTTQVEGLCEQLNKDIASAKPKDASRKEIERVAPRNAVLEHAMISRMETLTPPAAIATPWRQIMAYRRTLADELTALARAAKANDTAGIRRLAASKLRVHKKLIAAATQAGFKNCSRVG